MPARIFVIVFTLLAPRWHSFASGRAACQTTTRGRRTRPNHYTVLAWRKRKRPCRKRSAAILARCARSVALRQPCPVCYQHPTAAAQFSVPQFLGGGEGPPSNSDMTLCRNVAFWRESVASERKHAARARSRHAASATPQVPHHAAPAVLHTWPMQMLPMQMPPMQMPPMQMPPWVVPPPWVAAAPQPQQPPFTQPLPLPIVYYPIWLPPPAWPLPPPAQMPQGRV